MRSCQFNYYKIPSCWLQEGPVNITIPWSSVSITTMRSCQCCDENCYLVLSVCLPMSSGSHTHSPWHHSIQYSTGLTTSILSSINGPCSDQYTHWLTLAPSSPASTSTLQPHQSLLLSQIQALGQQRLATYKVHRNFLISCMLIV